MLSYSLPYGHILYCMNNETSSEAGWGQYWIQFIKAEAAEKGVTVFTTDMFDKKNWNPVVDTPSTATYVEGSKVGSRWTESGQTQYDVAVGLINGTRAKQVRPVNAVKVRTQKIRKHAQERLWRPLMAGFAALSHHRTTDGTYTAGGSDAFDDNHASNTYLRGGLGLEPDAQNDIKAMRIFTDIVVPWETLPRQDLLANRAKDEAYLRAKVGDVYGLYFVDTGSVGLNLVGVSGRFRLQWIDIAKGAFSGVEQTLTAGSTVTITTPGSAAGGLAAVITKLPDHRVPDPRDK